MSRQLATIASERSNRRVAALTDRLITQFGGMEGFISEWQRFYTRSSGLDQMRCLKAVLSLVRVAGSLG